MDRAGGHGNLFRYDLATYLRTLDDPPFVDVRELLERGEHVPGNEGALEFFSGGPLDVHPAEAEPACPDFDEHPGRQAFLADVTRAMDEAGVAALVYPGWRFPPAALDRGNEDYRGDNSQLVAPATGMPAVNVPMGYTTDEALPAGLQILGRRWEDGRLIQYAFAYEQFTQHRRPPPAFP